MDPFWTALALTTFAGLATVLGGVLAIVGRAPSGRGLGAALGLAAGVMLAVSFLEMLPAAVEGLGGAVGPAATAVAVAALILGAGSYVLLERAVPDPVSEMPGDVDDPAGLDRRRMLRLGTVTALAIGLHNLPEGFVTFAGTLQDPSVGLALAVAMAVHNVPEGVAVAVPVRQATGSRRKAFAWAAFTGIAEPLGALIGWLLLAPFLTPALLAAVFAAVAAVMVTVSLDALLPAARAAGGRAAALGGVLLGVAAMALSLDLLS